MPKDHRLRTVRVMVDAALKELGSRFDELYAGGGRLSIAPEKLLRMVFGPFGMMLPSQLSNHATLVQAVRQSEFSDLAGRLGARAAGDAASNRIRARASMEQEQPAKPRVSSGWGATGGGSGATRRVLTADQYQALRRQLADIDAKLRQLRQHQRERPLTIHRVTIAPPSADGGVAMVTILGRRIEPGPLFGREAPPGPKNAAGEARLGCQSRNFFRIQVGINFHQ